MSSIRVWMHVHIPLLKLEPTLPELFPEMHLKKGATFGTFACYSWIRRAWAPHKNNLLIISPTEENPTNRRKRGNVVWEIILSDCLFHRCNKRYISSIPCLPKWLEQYVPFSLIHHYHVSSSLTYYIALNLKACIVVHWHNFYEGYQCEFCLIYCLKLLLDVMLCLLLQQSKKKAGHLQRREADAFCYSGMSSWAQLLLSGVWSLDWTPLWGLSISFSFPFRQSNHDSLMVTGTFFLSLFSSLWDRYCLSDSSLLPSFQKWIDLPKQTTGTGGWWSNILDFCC